MPRIETAATLAAQGYVPIGDWAAAHKITRQMAAKYREDGRLPARLALAGTGGRTAWYVPAGAPKPDAIAPGRKSAG
jgi:hypothetical protein